MNKVYSRRLGACHHICLRPCLSLAQVMGLCFLSCEVRRQHEAQVYACESTFVVHPLYLPLGATNRVNYASRVVLGRATPKEVVLCRVLLRKAGSHAVNAALERSLVDISAQGSVARCATNGTAMCVLINEILECISYLLEIRAYGEIVINIHRHQEISAQIYVEKS
jgi:hypothetical protein